MMYVRKEKTVYEAEYRLEMLNIIRRDKFDFIMPNAMRDNNIDMWIHIINRGSNDPFSVDFGASHGCFIFTDVGEGKIEKALFGHLFAAIADESIYDVLGKRYDPNKGGRTTSGPLYEYDVLGEKEEIREYVNKHNPKKIAVNISNKLAFFDSLSQNDYSKLCNVLGEENSKKIISAEKVITDFRANRVHSEIVLYSKLCEIQRRIMEKGLRNIIPGKTSRREIALYGHGELLSWGLAPNDLEAFTPVVRHSDISTIEDIQDPNYIFQKGDYVLWDWGFERINLNYGTDFKRRAYLLKDDEIDLPIGVKIGWQNTLKAREIIKKTIKSGITARETMKSVVRSLEEVGFVHMPFEVGPGEIINDLGDSNKSGFSMDFHTVGNAGTDYEVGTSIAPQRQNRADMVISNNQFIAFEYFINQWIPEWNERMLFSYEEDVVITSRGCEFMYPRSEDIILV